MANEERPRNSIEALIDRPLFEDDSGGRGIGPTLGSRAPEGSGAVSRETRQGTDALPDDEDEPDLFDNAPERRPHEHFLGSEIARAGEDLSADALHGAEPPEDDALPPQARIERGRPGVGAPDLPVPPESGR